MENIIYKFMEEISKTELGVEIDCPLERCDNCPLGNCLQCDKITYEIKEIAKEYIAENEPIFTWKQFRDGKIAVHCDTEEKARDFINKAHLNEFHWKVTKQGETNYSEFKYNTCYIYNYENCGNLGCISKYRAVEKDYKIVKWNIKEEVEEMEKIKVSSAKIIVEGNKNKPYYVIEYKEVDNEETHIGFGSYNLDFVFDWLEKEFSIIQPDFSGVNLDEVMEKTFREVIADIKEGEVWEDDYFKISIGGNKASETGIKIELQENVIFQDYILLRDNEKLKLQRKEYTFTEAFKAYEEGKEIENMKDGRKLKKAEDGAEIVKYKQWNEWKLQIKDEFAFTIDDIRGKWYINN